MCFVCITLEVKCLTVHRSLTFPSILGDRASLAWAGQHICSNSCNIYSLGRYRGEEEETASGGSGAGGGGGDVQWTG